MNVAIVGHVDHGKSTIIGRLLADTNSLPEGKLERVKETCRRNSKPFEYSFLLDALKDEQAQGITIDAARVFFKTSKRKYIIIDTPGHIEFLKNVVTGASRAEAALLVIDAHEGIQENSKRYCYMLSMLGIKQIAVLINKMDLEKYSEQRYNQIKSDYIEFLNQLNLKPTAFIPVSGKEGDNIASKSANMPWYKGYTVLDQLDLFITQKDPEDQDFRMPVQDVYKFTRDGDNRRIVAGTIISGRISVGDEVLFYPSNKKSRIKSIESFNTPTRSTIGAGFATGVTITDHLYLKRGEMMIRADQKKPEITSRFKANIFWLGRNPFVMGKNYLLKIGAQKIDMELEKVETVIDASSLDYQKRDQVNRNEVAEVIFKLKSPIVFDLPHINALTSRFVIVDGYEIWGGGIITEALSDERKAYRDKLMIRNYKWERSMVHVDDRAEHYNQKSCLILITGEKAVGKKAFAKTLEKRLFLEGKHTYYLGIGSVLYGLDADIKLSHQNNHKEHMRRLAEIANIMIDSGVILIVTATMLTQEDLELIQSTLIMPERLIPIWYGGKIATNIQVSHQIFGEDNLDGAIDKAKRILQNNGIIFKP
ncbi:GTP-binding protein [Candidatus Harpocratesius sp.]